MQSHFQISPEMFNRIQVWALVGPLKADLYSMRPQVSLGVRGKYDVIAVLAEVRFECANSFRMAVCTAFFVTFHAAPLPKMHKFRATLADHARLCWNLCETEAV